MVGIPNAFGELVALQVMFFNRRSLSFIKKEGKLYNLKEKSMYILAWSPKALDSLYRSHADTHIFLVHTPSKSEDGHDVESVCSHYASTMWACWSQCHVPAHVNTATRRPRVLSHIGSDVLFIIQVGRCIVLPPRTALYMQLYKNRAI